MGLNLQNRVARYLLDHAGKPFTTDELAAALDEPPGRVKKAIQNGCYRRRYGDLTSLGHGSDRWLYTDGITEKFPPLPQLPPPGRVDKHPLLVGLLQSLPAQDEEFPDDQRQQWVETARVALDYIYDGHGSRR